MNCGLKPEHLNNEFFASVLGVRGKLVTWSKWTLKTGTGILSELANDRTGRMVGLLGFTINYTSKDGSSAELNVVLKSKPTDMETSNNINHIAQSFTALAGTYDRYKEETGFRYCHIREVEIARLDNPFIRSVMPETYHTICEPTRDIYAIVMEYITNEHFSLLNTVDDISVWTLTDVKVVLRDLANIHAQYLGKTEWLSSRPWLETKEGGRIVRMEPLWQAMLDHAKTEFPEMWTEERARVVNQAITILPKMWQILDSSPKTMTHNDCSPRNICLRSPRPTSAIDVLQTGEPLSTPAIHSTPSPATTAPTAQVSTSGVKQFTPFADLRTLYIYDWELATVDVPQHDVAEFLAFTLQPSTPLTTRLELLEFYWQHLQYYSGREYPWKQFISVYDLACLDVAMYRLMMYTLVHGYAGCHCPFLPRVVQSHFSYIMDQIAAGGFSLLK